MAKVTADLGGEKDMPTAMANAQANLDGATQKEALLQEQGDQVKALMKERGLEHAQEHTVQQEIEGDEQEQGL